MTTGHIRIEIVALQKLAQVHAAFVNLNLRRIGTEEKTSSIQRLGVEIRKDGVDQLLHIAVASRVCNVVNGKQDMKLRPSRFAVFLAHIRSAVMNGKGYAGKRLHNIGGQHPILRVFRMVVVAVNW
ncbi:hypothetical protein SDC9_52655 [bioreactor metagenome]|uniref:Uncharacterized protein n=1 Tax=bioreactor metagenome TaxID=1076179 RepID=A0A644WR30_9ZZZZ